MQFAEQLENKSHYVRDVVYREDAHTGYLGEGPRMMASLRNIGVSLLRPAGRRQIKRTVQQISRRPHRFLEIIHYELYSNSVDATSQWPWVAAQSRPVTDSERPTTRDRG